MMTDDEALAAYDTLQRKRVIIQGLMDQTRVKIEEGLANLDADPSPATIVRLRILILQGKIWVNVMHRLHDEVGVLVAQIKDLNKRANSPTIDPSTIEVPNFLPEDL